MYSTMGWHTKVLRNGVCPQGRQTAKHGGLSVEAVRLLPRKKKNRVLWRPQRWKWREEKGPKRLPKGQKITKVLRKTKTFSLKPSTRTDKVKKMFSEHSTSHEKVAVLQLNV